MSASSCSELLELCLSGGEWSPELLDRAIAEDDGRALMSIVVERLGDLFEPRLCEVYDRLFRQVIERLAPHLVPHLRAGPTPSLPAKAQQVYVLSRITLGADVAVTSVLLDAAKRRYPDADMVFVGPRKNYELFEADMRLRHLEFSYFRGGTLRERLDAKLWLDDGVVIDPDSRISQLGLLRVCPEERYCHFPSRAYGADTNARLPDLAARWSGDLHARPYIAPRPAKGPPADITVSLGVGENPAKRLDDAFERELLRLVAATGATVLVDKGGTAGERARVERALLPGMRAHEGAFAPFAAEIAGSKLFVGYDSAAGHVASACGVPALSIAKGFVSPRMAARWRPLGTVIDAESPDVLDQVRSALATCAFRR